MSKLNRIFYLIASIISIVVFLFFIISAFSDRISPEFSVYYSYLGMVFPFLFIFNLIFLIGWIFLRKWKWLLIYIIGFAISWESISTYFPIHLKEEIPPECIKLLTYNVMKFEHEKPHTKKSPNQILQYIVNSNADIICLQEFGAFTNDNHLNENDIKQALKAYPYYRLLKLNWSGKKHVYGLAVFSKFRITSFKEIPFDSEYNGAFSVELNVRGKKVTLINCHLESNKLSMEERSEYYELTKEFDSQKLDQITSSMNKRLTPAFKTRAKQAQTIAEYIKKSKNPYIIVCGDFNDTPISYTRRAVKGDLRDAFVDTGFGLGISYNRHRFLFRIDYILHSKNIKSFNCTVDRKLKNSDHYPVWTYMQLK